MTRTAVVTEAFTDTDGTALESHGAGNWALLISATAGYSGINTNQLRPLFSNTVRSVHRWAGAGAFTNDQYAELTLVTLSGDTASKEFGLIVRASADTDAGADYYEWYASQSTSPRPMTLRKVVNGTATDLDTTHPVAWVDGDVMTLEVVGSAPATITGYRNGTSVVSVTDSALASGKPGVTMRGISGGSGGPWLDTWVGGNVTTGAALAGAVTLDDVLAAGAFASGAASLSGSITLDDTAPAGTLGQAAGTLTTPPMKNNTGTLLANLSGVVVNVYSATTGTLVVRRTGLTSNAGGVVAFTDGLLSPGASYAYEVDLSNSSLGRRLPVGVAA